MLLVYTSFSHEKHMKFYYIVSCTHGFLYRRVIVYSLFKFYGDLGYYVITDINDSLFYKSV